MYLTCKIRVEEKGSTLDGGMAYIQERGGIVDGHLEDKLSQRNYTIFILNVFVRLRWSTVPLSFSI